MRKDKMLNHEVRSMTRREWLQLTAMGAVGTTMLLDVPSTVVKPTVTG